MAEPPAHFWADDPADLLRAIDRAGGRGVYEILTYHDPDDSTLCAVMVLLDTADLDAFEVWEGPLSKVKRVAVYDKAHHGEEAGVLAARHFKQRVDAAYAWVAEDAAAHTDVFDGIPGRAIDSYDLLEEVVDRYGLDRREAHESIRAFLADLGGDSVVLSRRPTRPELLDDNPHALDVTYWEKITRETAGQIKEAFAATYGQDTPNA
ncbi:hypothetical protein GCM10022221_68450 [Actinocorallia aurea]